MPPLRAQAWLLRRATHKLRPPPPALAKRRLPLAAQPVEISPYRIHALVAGDARGEAVLLIHGLSGSSRWWHRNIDALAAQYRVLVPDVIGFGRTRCPGKLPTPGEIGTVLAEWLDETGHSRAHVVGHSMGGQIAIHLAARHPQRVARLVLVAAAGIPRPVSMPQLARFALGVVPPTRWGDPLFFSTIVSDALAAGPHSLVQAFGNILRDDVRPLLPKIEARTLLVWGERDPLVPVAHARIMREAIPRAELVRLPRAGHNVMVDQPEAFNRVVLGFLAKGNAR